MRTQSTDAESKLWYLLRDRRLNGLKFRRQHPVGDYTLDFYCEQYRLAVELDGGQHGEAGSQTRDAERTAFLSGRGIRVLRFWNDEFLNQPEAVLEAILAATQTPSPGPSGHPLPAGEGRSPNGGYGLPLPPGGVGASAPGEGVGRPRGAGSAWPERDTESPSPGRSGRPEGKATRREGQTVAVSRAPSPGPSGHPLPGGEGRSPNGGDGLPLPPGEVGALAPGEGVGRPRGARSAWPERDTESPSPGPSGHPLPVGEGRSPNGGYGLPLPPGEVGASAPGEGVGRPRGAGSAWPERDTESPSPGPVGHPVPLGERKKLADLSVDKLEELYPQIHKALAAGLIDHIGLRLPAEKNERPEFQGPRGRKYRVFPGSTLAKKPPPWLLSAQLSQTSQLFARTNAEVQPQWLSDVGAHLVKKTVTHPVWNPERGEVQCTEYHTLFGLQLLKRTCHYGSIDPVDARRIFILEGLVRGQWTAKPRFLTDNLKLVDDVQDKEARMRRPDLLADESQRYAFYDERIPPQICTANTLKAWLRTASADKGDPGRLLRMQETDVLRPGADADVEARFPDFIDIGGHTLALSYQHEPGEDEDGVSFHIPLTLLYQLPDAPFDYLVPGLLAPRIEALIRSLPMNLRRLCTPAAEYANALATRISVGDGDFLQSVVRHFDAMTGVKLKPDDFDPGKLPAHLRPTLVLEDAQGQVIARADSLAALKRDHQQPARVAIAASAQREDAARRWVRSDIRDWDFGDLPEHVDLSGGGRAWPALTTAAAAAAATPSRRTGSLPAVTPPAPTPAPPRKLPPPPPAPRAAPAAPPSSPGKPSKPAVIESLQGLAQLRGSLPAAPSSPPPPPPPTVAAAPAATRPATASSAPASASVTTAAGSVSLALFESPEAARLAHIAGVRALLLAKLADRVRDLVKTARSRLGLAAVNPIITPEALAQAVAERAAAQTWDLASLRSEAAFKEAVQHRGDFGRVAVKLLDEACGWLMAAADLRKALRDSGSRWPEAAADIRQQLDSLLAPGLIDALPDEQWPRVAVWLKAIAIRLQRLPNKPQRDIELTAPIRALVAQLPHPFHPARWIVEEWRVAQFAQELKAVGSPTPDRIVQRLREPA